MSLTLSQLEAKVNALEEALAVLNTAMDGAAAITQLNAINLQLQNRLTQIEADIATMKNSIVTLQDIVSG